MWAIGRRLGGFTLIELMTVIAIMALVAGLFPLALNRFIPARRLSAAAQELAATIRDMQGESAASGRKLELTFDAHGYRAQRASSQKDVTLPETITLSFSALDRGPEATSFSVFPDGSTTGGRFQMRDHSRVAAVVVSSLTGRVSGVSLQ